MYTRMQQLRQQLHIDVHAQHRKLQQLLRQQQALQSQQQEGQTAPRSAAGLEQQICPVKRQMAVVLGGVDDSVSMQRVLLLSGASKGNDGWKKGLFLHCCAAG